MFLYWNIKAMTNPRIFKVGDSRTVQQAISKGVKINRSTGSVSDIMPKELKVLNGLMKTSQTLIKNQKIMMLLL